MPIKVDCPRCKRPLSVPTKMAGHYATCPQCRGRLWVPGEGEQAAAPAIVAAPPAAGPRMAIPPAAPTPPGPPSGPATSLAIPPPLAAPPAVPPAAGSIALPPSAQGALAPPRKVARLIVAEAAPSSFTLAEDGQLPELRLGETAGGSARESGSSGMSPLLLIGLLCLSVVSSLVLIFLDAEPEAAQAAKKSRIRSQIAENYFYDMDRIPRQPYEILLREAQLAHNRGDVKQERELYRRVLGLLRAEKPPGGEFKGLTGSPDRDKTLEELIVALLSE